MDAERELDRPHPNDPEVEAHMKRSGSMLSEPERRKLLSRIDAQLAELDERDSAA